MATDFAYDVGKKSTTYQNDRLAEEKLNSTAFGRLGFFLESKNSNRKYESRKILGFVRKNGKNCFFFNFLNFFYPIIILNFCYFLGFFIFLGFLSIF